jgi:Fe-S oxidoreductase
MTTTYDPTHTAYLDEADVRNELSRVFDVCDGCQQCVELCGSFPTLFDLIGRHADVADSGDAGLLTPAEQDQVVEECTQCKSCAVACPYASAEHGAAPLDFPRLMLRARAMRRAAHQVPLRSRVADQVLGRADFVGTMATLGGVPGSVARRIAARLTSASSVGLIPPYAKQRFSTWFARRPATVVANAPTRVTVYPTCLVEYRDTQVGKDLVAVYERNGIGCELSGARCCGAPWLHAGDVRRFTKVAAANVASLAAEIRRGTDLVVPQPTCRYVLTQDYPSYVGGPDADLVAEHTYDATAYLRRVTGE